MTIAITTIRSEPHFEVGSIITRDSLQLVERWCERAKAEQPSASRVYYDELRNRLGGFLEAMGRALLQSGERSPKYHRDLAIEHGEQRWDSGWSLSELVRDYQLLHLVILEHLAATLTRPLEYREAMAVGVFINDAIAASIAAYVANRDQEVRETQRAGMNALREVQARKDSFLALVAHELRHPVAPILNSAEALAMTIDSLDQRSVGLVGIIERQSRQLARILDDLTDLTRIAQGTLSLRRELVDVADAVDHAIQTVAPLFREKHHDLNKVIEGGPLLVDGDPQRLVQVFVNLLTNAAKYTPPGGQVTLIARRTDGHVQVVVRDTGPGIPADMLGSVFDMYTRGNNAGELSPDGLGIGLALVKECVALHGGSIEVESGPRQGAAFIVSLPLVF
jgi:signal transduction histidine kinase